MEKGLKALPGVRNVKVSLNDGYAELALDGGATTSLADIRHTIRKNGFTPRQAQVRIEGRLLRDPQLQLQAGTTVYALRFDVMSSREYPVKSIVIVTGIVEADASAVVNVQSIE